MATATKPNALRERFKRALVRLAKKEGLDAPPTYREIADRLGMKYSSYVHSALRGDIDRGGGPTSKSRIMLIKFIEECEK